MQYINAVNKILPIIDKYSIEEQIKIFSDIKEHVANNISNAQKAAEEHANSLQSTLDKINQK